MEIVLGLSITGTTARVVLVEGQKADGVTIESEVFDTAAPDDGPKPGPTEQVSNAILATQQNAIANGHHLVVSGVTWDGPTKQAQLRDSVLARGLDNVVLVPEQSAAGALAQTIGCALGYEATGVLLIKLDTVTLSIVKSADGSIAEGIPHTFSGANVADVIPEIVASLKTVDPPLQGIVIVGSRVATGVVKSRLEDLLSVPVIAPEEPELGLARGAALAAAGAVGLEAPTLGLAYSQDPDGNEVKLFAADTVVSPPVDIEVDEYDDIDSAVARIGRALLMPVGSLVAAVCVLGVVALMMSLAVSIGSTTAENQGSPAAAKAAIPGVITSTPPPVQDPAPRNPPVPQAEALQPPPSPSRPEPVQIAAEPAVAAPVIASAPKPTAQAPVVRQPAPSRIITEPSPVAAETPYVEPPAAVQPAPAEAQPALAPAAALPPAAAPPPAAAAPVLPPQTPGVNWPYGTPTLRIGPFRIPLGSAQPAAQLPQQQVPAWQPPQAPAWQPPQAPAWQPSQAPAWQPPQAPAWQPSQAPAWQPQQAPTWQPPQAPAYVPRGRGDRERWWPWG